MRPLDLDRNSTSPLLPAAADAIRAAWADAPGNPASHHAAGRRARRLLEDAREQVAALLGAHPDEVTFTSGATEANNLAVFGLAGDAGHLLAAPTEHPCVTGPLNQLAARQFALDWLPVSPDGGVPFDAVPPRLRPDTRLVAVMLANHETGAVQPVGPIVRAVPAGVPVLTDAAQAVGKLPVHFHALGVAALTASAHKFGGPVGAGLLLLKRGTPFRPLLHGGHQQGGRRPGTEPVPLAVGLAVALDHAVRHRAEHHARLEALRARLWERLQAEAGPVVLNGPPVGSPHVVPSTLNVSFPGCRADVLLVALDLAGVRCSAGSACSSGSLLPSPVLRAMSVPDEVLRSAVRFSYGPDLTGADIDDAAGRIGSAVRRLRAG